MSTISFLREKQNLWRILHIQLESQIQHCWQNECIDFIQASLWLCRARSICYRPIPDNTTRHSHHWIVLFTYLLVYCEYVHMCIADWMYNTMAYDAVNAQLALLGHCWMRPLAATAGTVGRADRTHYRASAGTTPVSGQIAAQHYSHVKWGYQEKHNIAHMLNEATVHQEKHNITHMLHEAIKRNTTSLTC